MRISYVYDTSTYAFFIKCFFLCIVFSLFVNTHAV